MGQTPLTLVAYEGYCKCIDVLNKNGTGVNLYNFLGKTPLMLAVVNGHVNFVKLLLSAKPDLDKTSCNGNTAVNLATLKLVNMKDRWIITHKLETIIGMLVKASANVNIPNNKTATPLLSAIFVCNFKCLDTLIENGLAGVNQSDNRMETALLTVASNGDSRSIDCLLKAGVFIDKHDQKHNTTQHFIVQSWSMIQNLLTF